ncbi:MAG: LytTR family DNA-binding domain-containing protein, partial [Halieaceae bacterium]|nr:LytTR family DNA-binding domain-containing protein [Halieaceae bacterium]
MKPLRAIVVDDESLARRGLALRLANIAEVEVIAQCANGEEALQLIGTESPDLVFLDIQMPGMDGFDLVCELQADAMPLIIFVTAFDQYAIDAFRVHAVDYLLKPIDEDRLEEAVARAVARHGISSQDSKERLLALVSGRNESGAVKELVANRSSSRTWPERLTIKDGSEFQFIKIPDIQWIDAAGDYMCVHAGGKTHIMRTTMKQLEASLDPDIFIRVHRSSIVNANSIASATTHLNGEYVLTLDGGAKLKVSRSYRDRIKSLLGT